MQGRFKRDGSAAAEQEPHGGTDRGSSPQHTQNQGPASAGESRDRGTTPSPQAPGPQTAEAPAAESKTAPRSKDPVNVGSRIALRNWRISTRLVSLLALPVVAATTLGGLRINESLKDMEQLDNMQLLTRMTQQATLLAEALQNERDSTAGPLSNNVHDTDYKVATPRNDTNASVIAFLNATKTVDDEDDRHSLDGIRANVSQIAAQLRDLTEIRKTAYADKQSTSQTVEQYNRLISSLLSLSQDMAQATSNPQMIQRTRALATFSRAKEYASIQRAIIAGALPPDKKAGRKAQLSENDRLYAVSALRKEKADLTSFQSIYAGSGKDPNELLLPLEHGNPEAKSADNYIRAALYSADGISKLELRTWKDWDDQSSTKIKTMKTIESDLLSDMEETARKLRNESEQTALLNGALILLVLGVSLVGAFVVARSMIRSLRRLQDTATRVAQDRLPELVKQLSETDPQDVDTSVESVGVHSRDEIGKVAAAFDDVHREAVRLAAEQALLRGNVNAMFTNLSRRSQGLIQRQLSLISELESREADPDQLSSLFKLDHLATRMRRNGENLLVLAGEEPGRRWTRPVPLVDVLRAAASEVEQYERIELAAVPATEVAGRVVNDLVHLLAELLENATSFSSPQTKVRVTGHALPDGRVLVEIHDTGIGLSPEDLAAINERLAAPPTVDVSVSRRMGLFVVGRLSLRHGIRIQLRPSDSGGTTALVMLPVDVAQGGKQPQGKPGAGQPGGAPAGRLPGAPGGADGQRPGGAGGPAGQGGQLPTGSGNRGALPARNAGQRTGQGADAFGNTGPRQAQPRTSGLSGMSTRNQHQAARAQQEGFPGSLQGGRPGQGGGQLPPPGGPRAQLPGGNPAPQHPQRQGNPQLPQPQIPQPGQNPQFGQNPQDPQDPQNQQPLAQRPGTSWGADQPRGHEEAETSGRFERPDVRGPVPPSPVTQTGQFERADVRGPVDPAQLPQQTGQFQRPEVPGPQEPTATAEFPRPDFDAPLPPQHQQPQAHQQQPQTPAQAQGLGPAAAPRQHVQQQPFPQPPQHQQPQHQLGQPHQPEALPPAQSPGDGRTPLYDTLETNWFHGAQEQQAPGVPHQPQQPERSAPPLPQRGQQDALGNTGATPAATTGSWRTSPNDELVRQAERAKKPAAGGVTTSGLPRRVPRANLVAGTAQQQSHQSGPQVSRAPDDVRGRLTNLRRGIQQGRQANNGPANSETGSFGPGPTHQQER
ncbi:nitrate- and nitrite sensing domain-containing protein [Streptomyces sp. NPDC050504]|uniref:nitrate- and nitrite sensing domain-containing protein n=1 Tax=Streptomyces sp. NPDC050504 TaxID=3365618 RepID=UPI0037A5EA7C